MVLLGLRNYVSCRACNAANFKRNYCWNCSYPLNSSQLTLDQRPKKEKGGVRTMLKKKVWIEIPKGQHTGKIVKVESRDEPFEYTDFVVEVDDYPSVQLKIGGPTNVSVDKNGKPKSKLAILLERLGVDLSADEIDEQEAVGKQISFTTTNEKTPKGTFARIIPETIEVYE